MDEKCIRGAGPARTEPGGLFEDDMVRRWSNLSLTQEVLGELYEGPLCRTVSVTPGELASDPAQYNAFLEQAAPELVSLMRTNSVTGAFVVLNTQTFPQELSESLQLPGLYLRDRDPSAQHQRRQRRSAAGARRWNWCAASASPWTATGSRCSCWRGDTARADACLIRPLQRGGGGPVPWLGKCGLLAAPHTLSGDNIRLISYSVPLIAPDGTGCTVFWVWISSRTTCCGCCLYDELSEDHGSAYILGARRGRPGSIRPAAGGERSCPSGGFRVQHRISGKGERRPLHAGAGRRRGDVRLAPPC